MIAEALWEPFDVSPVNAPRPAPSTLAEAALEIAALRQAFDAIKDALMRKEYELAEAHGLLAVSEVSRRELLGRIGELAMWACEEDERLFR